jgi:SAM-dependent methyltransferase
MTKPSYTEINSQTIDRWVENDWEWGRPITHEQYLAAKQGDWSIVLTPTIPVPADWFPNLSELDVLGLACGGGQQMPLFAAAGARCTVLDYSERQLETERMVAAREGYDIEIVRADMSKPLPFADASFDVIVHPVSNCYIREVEPVWRECYRILRPGGILLSGLDNGINYLFDEAETMLIHSLPYDPLGDEALYAESMKNDDGIQFSHTFEEQVGGQLKAGFMLTHLFEDYNGIGRLHELHIPTFVATRAVKPNR